MKTNELYAHKEGLQNLYSAVRSRPAPPTQSNTSDSLQQVKTSSPLTDQPDFSVCSPVTPGQKPDEQRLSVAMSLLERSIWRFEDGAPDEEWFRDYYELTGEHMILTDGGWEPGEFKQSIIEEWGPEWICDEVNAPKLSGSHDPGAPASE